MADYHVIPKGNGKNEVRRKGCKHSSSSSLSKAKAIKVAKHLAETSGGGTVIVHEP